ncbi:hypothetical protein A7982_12210 [Minicystis rosea]|nr:hypothetical protein A7982_12210 [Minicystis rosea]
MVIAKEATVDAPEITDETPLEEAVIAMGSPAAPDEPALIERLLEHVPAPAEAAPAVAGNAASAQPAVPALRTARVVAMSGGVVQIAYRGRGAPVAATLDEGVDRELVQRALAGNEAVLVEVDPEVGPVIVGVVQRRVADTLELKARKVVIDADEELLLRSGRGAMRIREDGDVELVGSRISTLSRGLFRIVGRVLRLN